VDHPQAHHLRSRDRAVRRTSRRFLTHLHRRHERLWTARAADAPDGGSDRARFDGHARPVDRRLGVAELEVPSAGARRGDDLCQVDADSEAAARRGSRHRDRRLARGCAHRGRLPLRGGRGGRERPPPGGIHPPAGRRSDLGGGAGTPKTAPATSCIQRQQAGSRGPGTHRGGSGDRRTCCRCSARAICKRGEAPAAPQIAGLASGAQQDRAVLTRGRRPRSGPDPSARPGGVDGCGARHRKAPTDSARQGHPQAPPYVGTSPMR
jgi:hypothetical protein